MNEKARVGGLGFRKPENARENEIKSRFVRFFKRFITGSMQFGSQDRSKPDGTIITARA